MLEKAPGPLTGVIRRATYLGDHLEYTVETELGPLFVVSHALSTPLAAGDTVAVRLSQEAGGVVVLAPR